MQDLLESNVTATHEVLGTRLSTAEFRRPDAFHPRDRYPSTDTFLSSTSRHVAATNEVLVAAVRRHLPDGADKARELTTRSRRLEKAMAQTKAKLYGGAQAIHRPWADIWSDLHRDFDAFTQLERDLVHELVATTATDFRAHLSDRIYRAELRAPTRPHPFVPHRGLLGRMARRVCLQVDHFWDAAEGRMIPEPVKPHDRSQDGLLMQYLLADPHMSE